ncbi:hypothetical protein [Pseudorhodoplanes sp.]|uniref:hypothetical protein n=1 Tax=Pseudorhodoplanes sp. TaxID=1934341 RepID=UPI00391BD525
MDIERRFYHYGLGAGIPYRALNSVADAVDRARNAKDVNRRRKAAQDILRGSSWAGFIPQDRGFAKVTPDTLPGTREAVEAALAVIEDRRASGWKARRNNPFYQCERPEDFVQYPALMKFALSDAMLQIVSDYYGMVPQLKEIGIWLTPAYDGEERSSQLYHLDKPECQIVGLFMNLQAQGADAGPLTLLPRNVSERVREGTGYESIYFRGDGRLTDEAVFSHCGTSDQVELAGDAGYGGFADTSNCFHFGSRCRSGERKMMVVKFILPYRSRSPRTPLFDLVPEPADEARKLALSGADFRRT